MIEHKTVIISESKAHSNLLENLLYENWIIIKSCPTGNKGNVRYILKRETWFID